ncbi:hypothetical protein BJY01DRAFT_245187 [Aspergillus pseudoustus]|uniref:Rhodopsin domain-containing protein n=1 Tax=Aspergillus pseudoustus TaxID=1810923 RepID=A0ABR4KGB2_9EURO
MEGIDLTKTPGMEPPAGHTPQFDAPWNSVQIGSVITFAVTYFFATLFLGLRYFQAFKLTRKVEVDLVTVTISYGVALVYFITMVDLFGHGWGKHMWDVSLADLLELNKALLPNTLSYLICPTITKMAILSVLYRINPSTIYRGTVIVVAVMIIGYTLALCIITGGPCSPLKDGTIKCLEKVALSQAILNLVSDFALVALPLPTIHNLHLPAKRKIMVGCILALGSGVVICSIARLPYVIVLPTTADTTYTQAVLGIWTIAEVNLGIICACAMRFKRLIATYLPKLSLFSSSADGNSRSRFGLRRRKGAAVVYESRSDGFQPEARRGGHSYQLHSVQNGSAGADGVDGSVGSLGKKDIAVYREFQVDTIDIGQRDAERDRDRDRDVGDTGSADKILR